MGIACSWSCCIDGFHRCSGPSLSSVPGSPVASAQGNASVIWRAIQSAVGWVVTLIQTRSRRGQPNDDERIEPVEADGRNDEQVHGGDVRRVVTQEGAPALGRRSTSLD